MERATILVRGPLGDQRLRANLQALFLVQVFKHWNKGLQLGQKRENSY
jgi:hypothetical protein